MYENNKYNLMEMDQIEEILFILRHNILDINKISTGNFSHAIASITTAIYALPVLISEVDGLKNKDKGFLINKLEQIERQIKYINIRNFKTELNYIKNEMVDIIKFIEDLKLNKFI